MPSQPSDADCGRGGAVGRLADVGMRSVCMRRAHDGERARVEAPSAAAAVSSVRWWRRPSL
eukprot:5260829-Prymnesium_polylepis.1